METTDSKKLHSCWWDSPKDSNWLAEVEEMGQHVKQIRKLIEEDGDSSTKKAEKRPELIALVEEFYRMYQSLAERHDLLTGELCKSIPSEHHMQGSGISESGSDQGSPLTPDQKLGFQKSGHQVAGVESVDIPLGSGGGNSDLSLKEGTEFSSSSSSLDSESEFFHSCVKNWEDQPLKFNGRGLRSLQKKVTELPNMKEMLQVADKDNVDGMFKAGEVGTNEKLIGRIIRYEEELRVSNLKLQLSEEEVARLKREFEKIKSVIAHAGNMEVQLESAQREMQMREADLELGKRQVFELQIQVAELETHLLDSNHKIGRLMEELEETRERLKGSDEEIVKLKDDIMNRTFEGTHQFQGLLEVAREDIAMLETKFNSERRQVLELQEIIMRYKADVSDRDHEIRELKETLSDAHEYFTVEKSQLQSDILNMSETGILLDTRLKEREHQCISLEEKMWQCEVEKMEMKVLHDAQMLALQGENNQLKAELTERRENVEALNKDFDRLKHKYDMLMAEKDGVNAKVQSLVADVSARDNQISQMEEHLRQLRIEQVELLAGFESARKLVHELRLRVKELEKEVDSQRIVISDGAEEKREVIRQLCFSLEHYRSGYKELRQAFLGAKRHAVMAA